TVAGSPRRHRGPPRGRAAVDVRGDRDDLAAGNRTPACDRCRRGRHSVLGRGQEARRRRGARGVLTARAIPLSYSVRSAFQRRTRTLLTVAVIALVVLAVTVMMTLVSGIQRALVGTGEPDNFIVLRKGGTNHGASQ